MLTNLVNIQYCYTYVMDQIPVSLILYSHVPTAVTALLFGAYIFAKTRNLASFNLFVVCLLFAISCLFDLGSWMPFLGSANTMFMWSTLGLVSLTFFLFSYYFLYVFITKHDLPVWQKIIGFLILLPTAVWTFIGANLTAFDSNSCEALEDTLTNNYLFTAEGFIIIAVLALIIYQYRKTKDRTEKREIVLAGTGVTLFLGFFLSSTITAIVFLNYASLADYAYNYEIYGLFGMPILLIYLGYLIVRYKAFHLKMFGVQALVVALVALIGSEFAFVSTLASQILVGITLLLVGIAGVLLTKSVRREIEQREHIEKLARELEVTNERQETLIHFIGHEVKGTLTKDMGVFASLSEGDFGALPDATQTFIKEALAESRQGADAVANILKASNLKKGTVTYTKAPFDLKALVAGAVEQARPLAEKRGLVISFTADDASYQMTGDRAQINDHVLRNLIDNAINYTPTGSIAVSLKKQNGKIILEIQDTGVGITAEDKKRLFTEGGHGKDAQRVNAHSTGYGLYIAKTIVEEHKGTIHAESEGAGKGSTFIVEFPV